MKCSQLIEKLENLAPQALAEGWDNTGLIVGDTDANINTVLVALDVTDAVIDEAIALGANIIITHHPMLFSAVKKITNQTPLGKRLLRLIKNNIGHFAMHTNLDTAFGGTNDKLAQLMGLCNVQVLSPTQEIDGVKFGLGRIGNLPQQATFAEVARILKKELQMETMRIVGDPNQMVSRVGICTGSGFDFIGDAASKGADLFVTGDLRYHESQKAMDLGVCVIDATHYASENIIVPVICEAILAMQEDICVVKSSVNGQVFTDI